jgi:peptide-methionine (S)-S-oxide reductase
MLAVFCWLILSMNAAVDPSPSPSVVATQSATFGGGCFWCLEAMFKTLDGVVKVTSGYAGGSVPHPTYQQVCSGKTGHAEVIQVEYDPRKISYPKLLEAFWGAHNPSTLNRQGPDVGTQYRSIILYQDENQKQAAEKSKQEAAKHFKKPIVTQIVPLEKFYPAEDYHQDYFQRNPNASYCTLVIEPKLDQFKKSRPK